MSNFDRNKFLSSDEQTQRTMIAEVISDNVYISAIGGESRYFFKGVEVPNAHTRDFRILAFELRDTCCAAAYDIATGILFKQKGTWKQYEDFLKWITPLEMICAALMAWPESEE